MYIQGFNELDNNCFIQNVKLFFKYSMTDVCTTIIIYIFRLEKYLALDEVSLAVIEGLTRSPHTQILWPIVHTLT